MSIKRKIVSLAAAAALAATSAASLSGCADISYALVIDGVTIPAGVYIMYSGYAFSDAESLLQEEQPDIDMSAEDFDYYKQTVSGMSFGDYVEQETVNYCKRYVAVNRLYDELGIEMEATDRENLSDSINYQWDYSVSDWTSTITYLKGCDTLGDYYQSIGVAKSSFKEVMTGNFKANEIFGYYYDEGGIEEVPLEDIKNYIDENYSLARYFAISLYDDDNNVIEDEAELAELEKLANGYIEKLNGGTSYSEVYEEYEKYSSGDEESAEEEEHEHEDSDFDRVINVESTSPSEEFVKALFEQKKGTAALFKADTYYYVVQRLDIIDSEDYIEDYTDAALEALKRDDMEDAFKAKYAGYGVTENTSAPDYARQQADNAFNALSTINTIQYYNYYYSSLFGGY